MCNYYGKRLLGDPNQGTKHLHNHFKSCIRRSKSDIKQRLLKTTKKGTKSVLVGSYAFNQDVARRAPKKMIIFHEYPMSMVDHILFKEFYGALQLLFKGISCNIVKGDIVRMYKEEKPKTMTFISKNQNKGYMDVTSHFIDDS
ncbi:hypothetical protein TanjilG_19200 [Lupinus angustifolius]|uniref:Uncharacterized protein n=1 Tax=Lupinus angustifolius TaxID=3871 RepID=A0A1J7GJU8_LUPAN|nr:hypothetical protein TanjilG_19200 [Lupinus angustifolius]